MKIYFCDVCNESIPLQDLKENKATTIKGKIFCPKCNPLNTLPPTRQGRLKGQLLAWVVIVLIIAGLAYLAYQVDEIRGNDRQDQILASLAGLRAETVGLGRRLDDLDGRLAGVSQRAAPVERLEQVEHDVRDAVQTITGLGNDVKHLSGIVSGTKGMRQEVSSLALEQQEIARDVQKLRESLKSSIGVLGERIDQALAEIATAAMSGATAPLGASGGGGVAGDASPLDPELMTHVSLLQDRDAGKRWAAVDALAASRNPSVVPYLLPLLNDADPFVQIRVVMALGDLAARLAVGKLIPLLRDSDPIVRDEVLTTLIRLTGMNTLRFDIRSTKKDVLERGTKKWEDWWEENREKYERRS